MKKTGLVYIATRKGVSIETYETPLDPTLSSYTVAAIGGRRITVEMQCTSTLRNCMY